MIDSGATGIFINEKMVNEHQLHRRLLKDPLRVSNIDGTTNSAGLLTHFIRMNITVGAHASEIDMLVTNIGPKALILGLPWLKDVNPDVDWAFGEMTISCDSDTASLEPEPATDSAPRFEKIEGNHAQRH